jgi:hypothetical protein
MDSMKAGEGALRSASVIVHGNTADVSFRAPASVVASVSFFVIVGHLVEAGLQVFRER